MLTYNQMYIDLCNNLWRKPWQAEQPLKTFTLPFAAMLTEFGLK